MKQWYLDNLLINEKYIYEKKVLNVGEKWLNPNSNNFHPISCNFIQPPPPMTSIYWLVNYCLFDLSWPVSVLWFRMDDSSNQFTCKSILKRKGKKNGKKPQIMSLNIQKATQLLRSLLARISSERVQFFQSRWQNIFQSEFKHLRVLGLPDFFIVKTLQ